MSKEERFEKKYREWREVEEYVSLKDSEKIAMFEFDISKLWDKNVSRQTIVKRRKRRKILESILKIMLVGIIILIIIVMGKYIINLYHAKF